MLRIVLFIGCLAGCASAQPSADWTFDRVRLVSGRELRGLVIDETPEFVRFRQVTRNPGRPTITFTMTLPRADIAKLDALPMNERATLKQRLDDLDPKGDGERKRMEAVTLTRIAWNNVPNMAWHYESERFTLDSPAPEEIVRRSAVRLELLDSAFARLIPPRTRTPAQTRILIFANLDDYRKYVGRPLGNGAYYDPAANRIVCGSDLQRFGEELESIRKENNLVRAELDKLEAEYRKLYGKKPQELTTRLAGLQEHRATLSKSDRHNDTIFDTRTAEIFAVLQHESFHAYLTTNVYPPPNDMPRWLNEGLAQIFETALLEAGELRIDHVDRTRLARLKETVRKGELMPLRQLLTAGSARFVVAHSGDRPGSDWAYQASWAIALYATIQGKWLGTDALDTFIRKVNAKEDPIAAFEAMVGKKLDAFDAELSGWLLRLQPDGTLSGK